MTILQFLKNINIQENDKENIDPNNENQIDKREYIRKETHKIIEKYILKHKSFLTEYIKYEKNEIYNSYHLNELLELYHKLLFNYCINIQDIVEKSLLAKNHIDEKATKDIFIKFYRFYNVVLLVNEIINLEMKFQGTTIPLIFNSHSISKHFKNIQNLLYKYLNKNGFEFKPASYL